MHFVRSLTLSVLVNSKYSITRTNKKKKEAHGPTPREQTSVAHRINPGDVRPFVRVSQASRIVILGFSFLFFERITRIT